MKRMLAAAVSVALAGALVAAPATKPASQPAPAFVVATYNINFRNSDLPVVAETICKSKADVVFLQETNRQSERFFRSKLRRSYPHMIFRKQPGAGGLGILSRARLRNARLLPRGHGFWGTLLAQVKLGGKDVQIVNVHLYPTVPRGDEGVKGLLGLFAKTEGIRVKEIAHIHSKLSSKLPIVMAGDFNSPPGLSVHQYLTSRGWIDSLASGAAEGADLATWHGRSGKVQWEQCLDYIFHTPDIKTGASRVIRSEASDHFLVVSTLSWAAKSATTQRARRSPRQAAGGDSAGQ